MTAVLSLSDVIAAVALIVGAALSMLAGIAVLRFPDLMSRIHAATKPQVLGIMLLMLGVGLRIGSPAVVGVLVLIVLLQFVTAPISAHLVVRAAYRRNRPSDRGGGGAGSASHEGPMGGAPVPPGETVTRSGSKSPTAAQKDVASETSGQAPVVADIATGDGGSPAAQAGPSH